MDRRYQAFVSSTYLDLIEERREVIQALLEIDCLPAGMEMFPAASESQWSLIKNVIDQSDFYIVVIGGRYGSTSPEGLSYTEMEYDYAVATDKPTFGFLHRNPGAITADKTDLEKEARERLDRFRSKVQSNHVKFYTSPEDLGGKVSRAMSIATRNTNAEGWVRGRFAMTPEIQTEMAELRAKVSEFALHATAQTELAIPDDLESGDDIYTMGMTLYYKAAHELAAEEHTFEPASLYWHPTTVQVSWNDLIRELGPRMFDDVSEDALLLALNRYAEQLLTSGRGGSLPTNFGYAERAEVSQKCFDDITLQLFALNLSQHGRQLHADHGKYWTLTSLGRDTLMKLRAIRKKRDEVS